MDLKILHAADLHLNSAFGGFPAEDREKLLGCQLSIPDILLRISKREKCNLWLLAGDILDNDNASGIWVAALKRAFSECNVPVFIAPGNHDYISSGSPWRTERWSENVYIFQGGIEAVSVPELDCIVYGAGFKSMDCDALLPGFRACGEAEHQVMVLHGDPIHGKSAYNPISSLQVEKSNLDYLALGHVHTKGFFKNGKTVCAWPGCPMGRGWDETGEKGIYITTIGEETVVDFVPLKLPAFYEMSVKGENELHRVLQTIKERDYYRLTLCGKRTAYIDRCIQSVQDYPNVSFCDATISALNPWDSVGEDSFRGELFELLQNQLVNADNEEARIISLAAEISSDILSGIEVDIP